MLVVLDHPFPSPARPDTAFLGLQGPRGLDYSVKDPDTTPYYTYQRLSIVTDSRRTSNSRGGA